MKRSRVTVITASVPQRAGLLTQAALSVEKQTYGCVPWLIRVEQPETFGSAHIAHQRNLLLDAVNTEWVAVLDDDDLLDPTYLERCAEHFDTADVIYTYCRNTFNHPEGPFDSARLQRENFIDAESLVRTAMVRAVGGWRAAGPTQVEDWDLWKRLDAAGARFACIPERLRDHRHGGWRTVTT